MIRAGRHPLPGNQGLRFGLCGGLGVVLTSALVYMAACDPGPPPVDPASHAVAVDEWRSQRHGTLLKTDGWLTLVGLLWLEEGQQSFGAAADNDFLYAGSDTPDHLGTFTLQDGLVRFDVTPGVRVTHGGEEVSYAIMNPDEDDAVVLEAWPLQWFVMTRGDQFAVRVKDAESPVRTEFEGIDNYPTDVRWRSPARFVVHDPPDTLQVPNILGTVRAVPSPGSVEFEIDGEPYRLAMWKDSDDLVNFFTAFGDETNGVESYGGGRFIWVDAPDENGWTVVDFNRSYNPPCVFTEFATCPLPPRQNRLPVAIEAGEKVYGDNL